MLHKACRFPLVKISLQLNFKCATSTGVSSGSDVTDEPLVNLNLAQELASPGYYYTTAVPV